MQESSDAAVDRWLRRELARTYDEVLDEAVPEQLIELLGGLELAAC